MLRYPEHDLCTAYQIEAFSESYLSARQRPEAHICLNQTVFLEIDEDIQDSYKNPTENLRAVSLRPAYNKYGQLDEIEKLNEALLHELFIINLFAL